MPKNKRCLLVSSCFTALVSFNAINASVFYHSAPGYGIPDSSEAQNAARLKAELAHELSEIQQTTDNNPERIATNNSSDDDSVFAPALVDENGEYQTVWEDLREHLDLPNEVDNPAVQQQLNYFVQHRGITNSIIHNAAYYIYYVYQEIKKHKLPTYFTMLPMLESGYDPFAVSRAGAVGLWQIMPSTASDYGLHINEWYDGRRDLISSTDTALNFLVYLHNTMGSWDLAAAAYDYGIAGVHASIVRNQHLGASTDYWSLALPSETRNYVPKLLALALIIKNPEQYGFRLPKVPDHPYLATVELHHPLDLNQIANLSGVSEKLIRHLNSGILQYASSPNATYSLVLPASQLDVFKQNLNNLFLDSNNEINVETVSPHKPVVNNHFSPKVVRTDPEKSSLDQKDFKSLVSAVYPDS